MNAETFKKIIVPLSQDFLDYRDALHTAQVATQKKYGFKGPYKIGSEEHQYLQAMFKAARKRRDRT